MLLPTPTIPTLGPRVLSVMGKAMGLARVTPGGKQETSTSVHSTPLPAFGGTPAFPSPRYG